MEQDFVPEKESGSRVNFIIAICAMLVSLASFYATYLQAYSAEQQVKAMTFPLIQYTSGNYDLESRESVIDLNLVNDGVGPAIIKQVKYNYQNNDYADVWKFLQACCKKELEIFENNRNLKATPIEAQILSSPASNVVLPINDRIRVLSLLRHESNAEFWDKLNKERSHLSVSVCYCSLLENCYVTENAGQIEEVEFCSS